MVCGKAGGSWQLCQGTKAVSSNNAGRLVLVVCGALCCSATSPFGGQLPLQGPKPPGAVKGDTYV